MYKKKFYKRKEVKKLTTLEEIREYGDKCHSSVNHMYGNKPYSYHLEMVELFVEANDCLLDTVGEKYLARIGARLHDTIEDTRKTYNDIKEIVSKEAAEVVYALSNEKGKTRAERANKKYYREIRANKVANFVKICDRLANVQHSVDTKSSMLSKYKEESCHFEEEMWRKEFEPMFQTLANLLALPVRPKKGLKFKVKRFIKDRF